MTQTHMGADLKAASFWIFSVFPVCVPISLVFGALLGVSSSHILAARKSQVKDSCLPAGGTQGMLVDLMS